MLFVRQLLAKVPTDVKKEKGDHLTDLQSLISDFFTAKEQGMAFVSMPRFL